MDSKGQIVLPKDLRERAGFSVDVLSEDKELSKTQYDELPIESITIEALK